MLDLEAGVLGGQLVEDVRDTLLVTAALGLDRESVHGLRKLEWTQVIVVLVVRIMQDRVELDLVDLGDCTDVPRHQQIRLHMLLALQQEHVTHLEGFSTVADEQLCVARDRALMDSKNAEPANEGIDHHLEYMGEDVPLGIWNSQDFLHLRTLAPQE